MRSAEMKLLLPGLAEAGLSPGSFPRLEELLLSVGDRLGGWAARSHDCAGVLAELFAIDAAMATALGRELADGGAALPLPLRFDQGLSAGAQSDAIPRLDGAGAIVLAAGWLSQAGSAQLEALLLQAIGLAVDQRLHGVHPGQAATARAFAERIGASGSAIPAGQPALTQVPVADPPSTLVSIAGQEATAMIAAADGPVSASTRTVEPPLSMGDFAEFIRQQGWVSFGEEPRRYNLGDTGLNAKGGVLHYAFDQAAGSRFQLIGLDPDGSPVNAGFYADGFTDLAFNNATSVSLGFQSTRSAIVEAFQYYQNLLGVPFVEVADATSDQVDFVITDYVVNPADPAAPSLVQPAAFSFGQGDNYLDQDGTINRDITLINLSQNWYSGGEFDELYYYSTVIHEIGHGLGLFHTGFYNAGSASPSYYHKNDSWQLSMMSYVQPSENASEHGFLPIGVTDAIPLTPMVVDVLALDRIYAAQGFAAANRIFSGDTVYGANTTITASQSVSWNRMAERISAYTKEGSRYVRPWGAAYTIVDPDGIDTLDFSGILGDVLASGSRGNYIDLRPSSAAELSPTISYVDGTRNSSSWQSGTWSMVAIAPGTIIENAIGGDQDDTMLGNDANNLLRGGLGHDSLSGGAGDDTLDGGPGQDTLDGGDGVDTVSFQAQASAVLDLAGDSFRSIERFIGSPFDDVLIAPEGAAITLLGEAGNDTLGSVAQAISLSPAPTQIVDGGSGTDTLLLDWSSLLKPITSSEVAQDGYLEYSIPADPVTGNQGIRLRHQNIEVFTITAGAANDVLRGGSLDDQIHAGAGDDRIDGRGGRDTIDGGAGHDTLILDASGLSPVRLATAAMRAGAAVTLPNGPTLQSIETLLLQAGQGDDVLDVRGAVLPGQLPFFGDRVVPSRLDGQAGEDTFALDLATSFPASFDGGEGSADLLIVDWSAATGPIQWLPDQSSAELGGVGPQYRTANPWQRALPQSAEASISFRNVERLQFTGGSAGDTLEGLAGDDLLDPGLGAANRVNGNGGRDTLRLRWADLSAAISFSPAPAQAGSGRIASADAQVSVDFSAMEVFDLVLGSGDDTLICGDGDDRIEAGAGNDSIDAGAGADSVHAGAGNDRILLRATALAALSGAGGTAAPAPLLDGGAGIDSLVLSGSGLSVDLSLVAAGSHDPPSGVAAIEVIDLDGEGANSLSLTLSALTATASPGWFNQASASQLGLTAGSLAPPVASQRDQLLIRGGSDDSLTVVDGVWTELGTLTGTAALPGSYTVWQSTTGHGQLIVNSLVRTSITSLDTSAPFVSSIVSPPAVTVVLAGGSLSLTLRFSEAIRLSSDGTATIRVEVDSVGAGPSTIPLTARGSSSTAAGVTELTFSSTGALPTTLSDADGVLVSASSLEVSGGSLIDLADNAVSGSFPALRVVNMVVDTATAEVIGVVNPASPSLVASGGTLSLTLSFSESVRLTDGGRATIAVVADNANGTTTTITLTTNGTAVTADGVSELTFRNSEPLPTALSDVNGVVVRANSLVVTSGSLTDLPGNPVSSDFAALTAGNQRVDTTAPAVIGVVNPANATVVAAAGTLSLRLTFSEPIRLSSGAAATITVEVDNASGGGSTPVMLTATGTSVTAAGVNELTFSSTAPLPTTLNDTNGVVLRANSLEVSSGNLTDQAGNAVSGVFAALTASNLRVDTAAPLVTISAIGGTDQIVSAQKGDTLVTGTAEANRPVEIVLDGGATLGSITATANGSFSYVLTPANLGVIGLGSGKLIRARQSDGAGNTGSSAPFSFTRIDGLVLVGTSSGNRLTGGSGSDSITGLGGNDTLTGNGGNDTLLGGEGNDILKGGSGADLIDGGPGSDSADYSDKTATQGVVVNLNGAVAAVVTVAGNAEDTLVNIENVIGGAGGDRLVGDGLANSLSGNGGNDTLSGGGGNDTLNGGLGLDSADYSDKTVNQAVVVSLNGSRPALVQVAGVAEDSLLGIENLIGGAAGDTFNGDTAANLLSGNGGNDTLSGNGGNDTLNGGAGDDLLRGGLGNDRLDGGDGLDSADYSDRTASQAVVVRLNGSAAAAVSIAGKAEDTLLNIENIIGGAGADSLTGDALPNVLSGNGGNDTLSGGAGDDSLKGGSGRDTLDGGDGNDTADYSDKTASQPVAVILDGFLDGSSPDSGVSGAIGGTQEDTLIRIENVIGGAAGDVFKGDGFANILSGMGGNDALMGEAGQDLLLGGSGNDSLYGGEGNDSLEGGDGDDLIFAGLGRDQLTGGAGADRFRFDTAPSEDNQDQLNDFSREQGDVLIFSVAAYVVFTGANSGPLGDDQFLAGAGVTAATTASQRFIYDSSSGLLRFDADGTGSGSSPVEVARLGTSTPHPLLLASDLEIV